MTLRVALSLLVAGTLAGFSGAASAQTPAPSCQDAALSPVAKEAKASLARDPAALETRFKLADALSAQECYQDAVRVLEAGESLHPQNATLEARLRSARSMISEQNYIESVTRAEEGARLQRNQLRCRRLADIAACDEALAVRRNDPELLAAKAAALAKKGGPAQSAVAAVPEPVQVPATQAARPKVVAAAATPRPRPVVYSNEAPVSRSN